MLVNKYSNWKQLLNLYDGKSPSNVTKSDLRSTLTIPDFAPRHNASKPILKTEPTILP